MKLGLINSAWAQAGQETAWGIQQTQALGFDSIDIFADPLDMDIRERCLIKRECDRHDLPIMSIACVAVGLIDFNPSVQRFSVDRVKAYLDLAYDYEARNVLLVLGEYIWNREVIPPAEQWRTGVENCRRLADYAGSLGLQIAMELEPFHQSLLNTVDSMCQFIDEVNHPALQANIDISHLRLMHIAPEELRKLRGKAIHVHISDCDGKVHGDMPAGMGVTPIKEYLQAIVATGYEGTVSIELEYAPEGTDIVAWAQRAYDGTAAIMTEIGVR